MFDKLKKLFSQSSKANTDGTTFIRAAKPSEAKEAGGTRVREDAPQGHTVVKPVQAIAFSGRVARERLQEVFGDEFYVCDMLEGGMGHVYIGYCMRTGRYQAAKTFKDLCFQNPDGTIDKEIVQRFTRESVAWLSLGEHPNIVRADTLFEFQGKPYLFLELVAGHEGHGPTLKDWLAETKENIPLMLDYAIQCCEGMAYAAEKAGIVHRDLKPSNILVAEGGIAKITDFGLVKILTEPGGKQPERASGTYSLGRLAGLTLAGSTFGTPYYMPPEQWAAPERVDQRSDIYSFGAVMYAMLTGRPPFIIPDNLSSAHPGLQEEYLKDAHTSKEPEAIGGLNKKVDPELCRIVRQCLQKMPDDRPRSFRELKELLAECYKKLTGRSFCMPEPTVSYWDIVIAGKKKLESGSFEEAIPYFENVLRNDKRIFHAMQPLAQCCMMLKEFDKKVSRGRGNFYPPAVERLMRQARTWSRRKISRAFEKLAFTDALLKSSRIDKKLILEHLILQLA